MNTANDALLLEVARCPNVRRCFESRVVSNPCSRIVAAQGVVTALEDFQLPEPWNGQIETAPILFVSWNPSWNPEESPFPTRGWRDEDVIEFFRTRFEHTGQNSQTWREMRGIADYLLNREPHPGIDYAVTDVVRCKSRKGEGAREALGECTARYLRRTLEASGAKLFVALGKDARKTMASYFGVPAGIGVSTPKTFGGRQRILVQLGAPGAAEPRRLPEDDWLRVQSFIA